jgi:hypothetical protein
MDEYVVEKTKRELSALVTFIGNKEARTLSTSNLLANIHDLTRRADRFYTQTRLCGTWIVK